MTTKLPYEVYVKVLDEKMYIAAGFPTHSAAVTYGLFVKRIFEHSVRVQVRVFDTTETEFGIGQLL